MSYVHFIFPSKHPEWRWNQSRKQLISKNKHRRRPMSHVSPANRFKSSPAWLLVYKGGAKRGIIAQFTPCHTSRRFIESATFIDVGESLFVFCCCCFKGLFIHSVQILMLLRSYKVSLMKIMNNVFRCSWNGNSFLVVSAESSTDRIWGLHKLSGTYFRDRRLWLSRTLVLLLEWCSLFGIMLKLWSFLEHLNNIRASRNGTRLITILSSYSCSFLLPPFTRLSSVSGRCL